MNITVTRNEFKPVFDQQTYRATINETAQIGLSVLRVNATDQDGVCVVMETIMNCLNKVIGQKTSFYPKMWIVLG